MKIENKTVGVIGGGWYGAHISLVLKEKGYEVTLFEKNSKIFNEISGRFGIRLHVGPHYPRSSATRKSCHQGFEKFKKKYSQLLNQHEYSIYALGKLDADNKPPKVNQEQFQLVCKEFSESREIALEQSEYKNLLMAMDIEEPSIVVGQKLRNVFETLLGEAKIEIHYNFAVNSIQKVENYFMIINAQGVSHKMDYVVNTTGYQSLLPIDRLPFEVEIIYQPCLALVYRDKLNPPSEKAFSFIVMDGWFPCIMPYDDGEDKDTASTKKYIVTHGKYTTLGSYTTALEAQCRLSLVDNEFIEKTVKPSCEAEVAKFWRAFATRFQYLTWTAAVLPKFKTDKEFRSAVTFEHKTSGVAYVVPGKVSNIFDAEREVLSLIKKQNILETDNYRYIENGTLHDSMSEIKEKPAPGSRSTCELQPYRGVLLDPLQEIVLGYSFQDDLPKEKLNTLLKEIGVFSQGLDQYGGAQGKFLISSRP